MQSNFDTLIQLLSLRCQPEEISQTFTKQINNDLWYYFDFTLPVLGVFSDGEDMFGALLQDCQNVPMMPTDVFNQESLDSLSETPNIKFEVLYG